MESAITKTFSDFDLINTMTYKRMPGIINRNAFTAKNTCGSKNRSYGVRPTKAKNIVPNKKDNEPSQANV